MKIKVSLKVKLFPTESREKINLCIQNLIGDIPQVQEEEIDDYILLTVSNIDIHAIERFFNYIRRAEILDSVRYSSIIDFNNNTITFNFHKQALFIGKFAIIPSDAFSPFGNVEMILKGSNPEKILDWIAPQTMEGKVVIQRRFNDIFKL